MCIHPTQNLYVATKGEFGTNTKKTGLEREFVSKSNGNSKCFCYRLFGIFVEKETLSRKSFN